MSGPAQGAEASGALAPAARGAGAAGGVDVSVIIVSYNTREVTLACVRSVFERTRGPSFEVIVVDNASTDGSAQAIGAAFPQATVIANDDNRGFASANNQGLEVAAGRFVLLLNPDTEVNEQTIPETLAFALADPGAGVIGVRAFAPGGRQQGTLFRRKRLLDVAINVVAPGDFMRRNRFLGRSRYAGIDLDRVHEVDIVAGCYMFVRREVYEHVGGMDGAFFMYGEEAEWCYRIRKAGWRVMYFPGASILHYGGVSADRKSSEMTLALAKSNLLLLQRTNGRLTAYLANILMLLRDTPRALVWTAMRILRCHRRETKFNDSLRRASARFGLHVRGLARLDWST